MSCGIALFVLESYEGKRQHGSIQSFTLCFAAGIISNWLGVHKTLPFLFFGLQTQ
jgi:hypothetical protein